MDDGVMYYRDPETGDTLIDYEAMDAYDRTYDANERCSQCGSLVFLNHDRWLRVDGKVEHKDCRDPSGERFRL